MLTPYNPLRGVDLYVDASGEDDWDVEHDRYYLHGFMWTGPSEEWLAWMNAHKTKYEGLVHWANGEFGKDNKKLPNKKEACRGLLSSHPWSQTGIYVFDKKLFKEFVADRYGRKPTRYEIVKRVWKIMGVSYLNQLVPHLKKLVPEDPYGCLNVHDVIVNIPKGGVESEIESVIKTQVGRTPKFVTAGHFGIDALDGVLWAFHRLFNLGKTDCLPRTAQDFPRDLKVGVVGIKSEKPVFLRNANDIRSFQNG